ncbi:histidine kinase [Altericroceibacterium spongiae]|uniref:histidine kinase n=1 Tax=Altericroceibacterium spongiae TaxID=2320269 RepID=A0A420ECA7_9SPHN|nr:CHASE domain-containing protein [Altericroceibacterium spongiae]RKF18272.1 histidine kinase [Altericroceibacterium spongiae]
MAGSGSSTKQWLVRYPRAVPLTIFLLIAAITALSVYAIERGEDQRSAAQLRTRAAAISSALERRANSSSAYLRAGAALLAMMDDVPASRFRRFVSELRLDAEYRGADGIGWAQVVRPDEVAAFNELMQREGPGNIRLHPRPGPAQAFSAPVTFLQPDTQRNRLALGFDMFSEPVRRAAMLEAERTARPTASGKVVLKQEGKDPEPGFLIYMPVFKPAPGGRALKGFIYSPFNAQDFFASALELEGAGNFSVSVYDQNVGPQSLLAQIDGLPREDWGMTERQVVTIANHPWVLELHGARTDTLSGLSMATLIFGFLVAMLLTVLIRILTAQAMEDEAALRWLEEQASIRNSLTRELNHRVKNTLANVLSIIALTRRRADNLGEFADGLDGRIRALSATHDLLTQSDWGTTPVRAVVQAELLPYAQSGDHEVTLEGAEVQLAPNDALSLGLAIHELATNAAKYGALSRTGGVVSVVWEMLGDDLVRITWQERGGPPVPPKRGRGFGIDLIEKIVAHEVGNPVDLRFEPEGVSCVLTIPVREPKRFAMRAPKPDSLKNL